MQQLDAVMQRPVLTSELRLQVAMFAALCRADDDVLLEAYRRTSSATADPSRLAVVAREICLQGIAYCGFPRALHALFLLGDSLPSLAPTELEGRTRDAESALDVGWEHFASIYGGSAPKLRDKIHALDPAFERLVLEVAYGRLLAREGLDAKTRELLGVAGLSVLGHPTQMLSHAFGARRHGASDAEILESIETVEGLWPESGAAEHREFLSGKLGGSGG